MCVSEYIVDCGHWRRRIRVIRIDPTSRCVLCEPRGSLINGTNFVPLFQHVGVEKTGSPRFHVRASRRFFLVCPIHAIAPIPQRRRLEWYKDGNIPQKCFRVHDIAPLFLCHRNGHSQIANPSHRLWVHAIYKRSRLVWYKKMRAPSWTFFFARRAGRCALGTRTNGGRRHPSCV